MHAVQTMKSLNKRSSIKPLNKRSFCNLIRKYNVYLGVLMGHLDSSVRLVDVFSAHTGTEGLSKDVDAYIRLNRSTLDTLKSNRSLLAEVFSENKTFYGINSVVNANFSNSLINGASLDNILQNVNEYVEPLGNLSNTCIFRDFRLNGRKITTINQKLPENLQRKLKLAMKGFEKDMYYVYDNFYLNGKKNINDSVTGFIKGKSYISHASSHLGCKSAVSVDISKFYDSISLANIINNRIFYHSLAASFEMMTGMKFEEQSFKRPEYFEHMERMFGLMNVTFITVMNFYTHNGVLPTGSSYSPIISNILFAPMDLGANALLDENKTYTRYADDICISSAIGYKPDGSFDLSMDMVNDLERVVNSYGFYLNYDKTLVMGPRDKKQIAGVILDSVNNKLSIGSAKKLEFKQRFEGKAWADLDSSDRGTVEWVRNINMDQYNFIMSGVSGVPERAPPGKNRNHIVQYSGNRNIGMLGGNPLYRPTVARAIEARPVRGMTADLATIDEAF
jgi:hypothetical protein